MQKLRSKYFNCEVLLKCVLAPIKLQWYRLRKVQPFWMICLTNPKGSFSSQMLTFFQKHSSWLMALNFLDTWDQENRSPIFKFLKSFTVISSGKSSSFDILSPFWWLWYDGTLNRFWFDRTWSLISLILIFESSTFLIFSDSYLKIDFF